MPLHFSPQLAGRRWRAAPDEGQLRRSKVSVILIEHHTRTCLKTQPQQILSQTLIFSPHRWSKQHRACIGTAQISENLPVATRSFRFFRL
jgi:hypothetical protein